MHLYELSAQYRQLIASSEDSELNEETLRIRLKDIAEQFDQKAENMGKLVKELEAETVAIKNEVDRLTNRKRVAENKIEWLKSYLLEQMLASGIDKIPGQLVDVSLRKAPISVIILDQTLIPEEFIRTIPETKEPNKSALIQNFKDTGEVVAGCEFITNKKTIQIK